MSLWKIAWRSMQQRALASWLTGLSMALGVALVIIVLVIYGVVSRKFTEAAQGYHLLVGKKGGSFQLVLSSVFHVGKPIENIPYNFYKQFITYEDHGKMVHGRYAKRVEAAVPYCLGDSYQNYRVVATTPDLFEKLSYGSYSDGRPKQYRCSEGNFFGKDEEFGAVVGYVVAHNSDLKLGKEFKITHNVPEAGVEAHSHNEKFKVVGILAPTNTPNDQAIFINIKGFFDLEGHEGLPTGVEPYTVSPTDEKVAPETVDHHDDHDHEKGMKPAAEHDHDHEKGAAKPDTDHDHEKGAIKPDADHDHDHEKGAAGKPEAAHAHEPGHDEPGHDEHAHDGHGHDEHGHHHHAVPDSMREVTAVLLLMKGDLDAQGLAKIINKGNVAQAVSPVTEVSTLMEVFVGPIRWILLTLSILVVIVAGIGVMVSIYNSMSDRRRDIAIMRSLGAGRDTVMLVVLLESIMLSILGGLAGVVIAHAAIGALSSYIVTMSGVSVSMFQFEPIELILVPALIVLASIVGYLPALSAYRTDVAKALSAAP